MRYSPYLRLEEYEMQAAVDLKMRHSFAKLLKN